MVANGFGYNETPETLNEKMKQAGSKVGAALDKLASLDL